MHEPCSLVFSELLHFIKLSNLCHGIVITFFDVCRICSSMLCCFPSINNAMGVISHFIKEPRYFSWSFQRFQWFFFPLSTFSVLDSIGFLLQSWMLLVFCSSQVILMFFLFLPMSTWVIDTGTFFLCKGSVQSYTFFLSYCFSYNPATSVRPSSFRSVCFESCRRLFLEPKIVQDLKV